MKRFFILGAALIGSTPGLYASTTGFAHTDSDLPVDPAVTFGQLSNGVRYVIMANREPRERAALRLMIEAGSLQETEAQRGLAHFLEHMAFNGSEHYPPGTLIEFFQRMGMNFGGDTNAYTSFDRTVYMIDLPNTNEATLEEGFRVFGDYAGGLLLGEEELEHERGVILSEKRTGDSVEFRSFVAELEFVLGDSRLSRRIPIGQEEIIETAPRSEFVDFYDTWYAPERITVVAVGDFDPALAEEKIITAFTDLIARAPAQPDPDLGALPESEGISVLYHEEPEAGSTAVSIQSISAYAFEPDTAENRLKYLPRSMAISILNRRLTELAKKENAPFSSGRTSVSEDFDFYRNASIEIICQPDQWEAALEVADHELRRALLHGFQEPELIEVVASFRNDLEQAVKRAPTRRSSGLAGQLISAVADRSVFTTPDLNLDLYAPALDQLTVEQCLTALREAWSIPHRFVTVIGNAPIEGDAESKIATVYEEARLVALERSEAIDDIEFAYTDFGPAGTVIERRWVEDLDLTQVVYSNGVRLNVKKTDFEAGRIGMSVRLGGGQLTESSDTPGLSVFASNVFSAGGLGAHSSDDLRRILAGRNVGVGFSVGDDAFTLTGGTTPEDLLLQLQLTAATIVDPGYRPEAERQIRKGIQQYYTRMAHLPEGPLQLEVARLLAGGDPRFGMPLEAEISARNIDEVRAWLAPSLANGAIEIGLVGDLDVDQVIEVVRLTLGALPDRVEKPAFTAARQVSFPDEPFTLAYAVPTEIPKGVVALYWPTTDSRDVGVARRLSVLANVLTDRLRVKVREELGGAYSPRAGSSPSDTYENYGYITARITVEPDMAEEIADVAIELAADLARNGVTEDELERAKEPVLTSLRESARTNGYWLGAVLLSAQEFPERLEWSRSRYGDIEGITTSELDVLAEAYLAEDRVFRVIVMPEMDPDSDREEEEAVMTEVGVE